MADEEQKKKLTEKEELFCQQYLLNGFNKTKAALSAGYSPDSAKQIGYENFTKPYLRARIAQLRAEAGGGGAFEKVIQELGKLAYSDIREAYDEDGNLLNIKDLPDDIASAVQEVTCDEIRVRGRVVGTTKKLKVAGKNAALDSLARILGFNPTEKNQPLMVYNSAPMTKEEMKEINDTLNGDI